MLLALFLTALTTESQLATFERAVARAARELRVGAPPVELIGLADAVSMGVPGAAAFVTDEPEWRIRIVWPHLMAASPARLQCWARHEMLHVQLKHGVLRLGTWAANLRESARRHDQVALLQQARWGQDSGCLIP